MTCEKCGQGTMESAKLWRFSGCLVAIGFSLLIPALLGLAGATFLAIAGMFATATSTSDASTRIKTETVRRLRAIPVDEDVVDEFFRQQKINESTLAKLEPKTRREVQDAVSMYNAQMAGAGLGAAAVGGLGTLFVIGIYAISIPSFIVGLVLLLRKKVWKCSSCGYVVDRA